MENNNALQEVKDTITQLPEVSHPNDIGAFVSNFRETYKLAKVIATSNLIPQQYQNKPADCAIAIDMASRMGLPPIMVMQNLYVVKGKPSWSGQACMAFLRNKYVSADPVYFGTKGTNERGCFVRAKTAEGEVLEGVSVTISMAKEEGWFGKPGSKWKTMPELMLAYRAAAFFARVYCPEILMGITVQGEADDTAEPDAEDVPDPFSAEVIDVEAVGK